MKYLVVFLLCACALGHPVREEQEAGTENILQKVLEANPHDNDILQEEEPVTVITKEFNNKLPKNEPQTDKQGNETEKPHENNPVTEKVNEKPSEVPEPVNEEKEKEKETSLGSKLIKAGENLFDKILLEVKDELNTESHTIKENQTVTADENKFNTTEPEVEYTEHINEPIVPTAEVRDIIVDPLIKAFERQPAVEIINQNEDNISSGVEDYYDTHPTIKIEEPVNFDESMMENNQREPVERQENVPIFQNDANVQDNQSIIMPDDRVDEIDPVTDFSIIDGTEPYDEIPLEKQDSIPRDDFSELAPASMEGEFHPDIFDTPPEEIQEPTYNNDPFSGNPIALSPADTLPFEPSIFDHINREENPDNIPTEIHSTDENEDMSNLENGSSSTQQISNDENDDSNVVHLEQMPFDSLSNQNQEDISLEPVILDETQDTIIPFEPHPDEEGYEGQPHFPEIPTKLEYHEMNSKFNNEMNVDSPMENLPAEIPRETVSDETSPLGSADPDDYTYNDSFEPDTHRNEEMGETSDLPYEPTAMEENFENRPSESEYLSANFNPHRYETIAMEENTGGFENSNVGEDTVDPNIEQYPMIRNYDNFNFENYPREENFQRFHDESNNRKDNANYFSFEPITNNERFDNIYQGMQELPEANFMKKMSNNYEINRNSGVNQNQRHHFMPMNDRRSFEINRPLTPSIEIPMANNNPVGEIIIAVSGMDDVDNTFMLKSMSNHEKRHTGKNTLNFAPMAGLTPVNYQMAVPETSLTSQDQGIYSYFLSNSEMDRTYQPKRKSGYHGPYTLPVTRDIYSENWPTGNIYNMKSMMNVEEFDPSKFGIVIVDDAGVSSNFNKEPPKGESAGISENELMQAGVNELNDKNKASSLPKVVTIDENESSGISLNDYPFDTEKAYAPTYHHQYYDIEPNMYNYYYPRNFYANQQPSFGNYGPFRRYNAYGQFPANNRRDHHYYHGNDDATSFRPSQYDIFNARRDQGFRYQFNKNYNQIYPTIGDDYFYRMNRRNNYENTGSFRPYQFY